MNDEERPDPDNLLEAIMREERCRDKGCLKIFLGMAAGVGKTYAMLEAAQNLKKHGQEPVIGTVATHGREETAQLLKGLQQIPEKQVIYKDNVYSELDLDEILKQKPKLVLVDELAHSNIPGSRHIKRWQDVEEILGNGIDVYTTLNIQHVESLKDVVEGITGIVIRETVPDLIIDTASVIELIDLAPDELLQRLKDGKVYLGAQAEMAVKNFFLKDRLTALREIVLRYAAEKVDHDLKGMATTTSMIDGWRPREKLLIAVSSSPHSQKLIRTGRRLSFNLNAPWIALYVNDGSVLNSRDSDMLTRNLALARDLGAEVMTTNDPDIAMAIERVARQMGVTQIIIGRPLKRILLDFFTKPLLDRLASKCNDIDVHVIRQISSKPYRRNILQQLIPVNISSYLLICFWVLVLTGFNWLLVPYIGYKVIGFIFLLGILFLSLFFRKGPIFLASILFALIWDFLFIPPMDTLSIDSQDDLALLILYFLTAVVTGVLVDREREHKEMLIKRERITESLYEIVRDIATAPTSELLFKSVNRRLGKILNGACEIIIKTPENGLNFDDSPDIWKDEKERNAAMWVFENGKEAGWSTSTLPLVQNFFIPLKGLNETVGILAFKPNAKTNNLSIEEKNLLYTVGQQVANNLERWFSLEKKKQVEYLNKIEKVHQTILKLIAHEFQNPLVAIKAAVSELKGDPNNKNKIGSRQLRSLENSSEGLNRILENISVMAQLTGGIIPINKKLNNVRDLIGTCIEQVKKSTNGHVFKSSIQEDLPLISFDFNLIKILVCNLIFNAMQYSPSISTVSVQALKNENLLVISVLDEGKGIPEDQLETIFERFYRIPGTASPGVGLGLALAKTIAEIHKGYLKAENRESGGAKFSLFLPIELKEGTKGTYGT
jgi:two-component system, OmpR family, sensor histidine kinase KdpD